MFQGYKIGLYIEVLLLEKFSAALQVCSRVRRQAFGMKRDRLNFGDSCNRECELKFVNCGGPTVSALGGYACEKCLEYIVSAIDLVGAIEYGACSYRDSGPVHKAGRNNWVCRSSTAKALTTVREW